MPPAHAVFYSRPESLDDVINHNVDHVLNLSGLDTDVLKRWQGLEEAGAGA